MAEDVLPQTPAGNGRAVWRGFVVVLVLLAVAGALASWKFEDNHRAEAAKIALVAAQDRMAAEEALRLAKLERQRAEEARLVADKAQAEVAAVHERQAAADQVGPQQAEPAAAHIHDAVQPTDEGCSAQMEQAAEARVDSAARLSAQEAASIDPRDSLAHATAAWRAARRELALTAPGTQEYYEAITRVNEAQRWLTHEDIEGRALALTAGIDLRDKVALAEAAVKGSTLRLESLRTPLPAPEPLYDFEQLSTGKSTATSCG